ncbi:MAG: hypothetical protein MUP81_03320 [Dehalococcoidia bacterium]|nr:hypothetical protein [Dehalococcoidia bacterium]
MSRPKHPGCILPASCIQRLREDQATYDKDPDAYGKHKKEWSLEECKKRGCLPTGEPLEALFGTGY